MYLCCICKKNYKPMFKFPEDERLDEWIAFAKVSRATYYSKIICHKHFTESCISIGIDRPTLTQFAIPTLYPDGFKDSHSESAKVPLGINNGNFKDFNSETISLALTVVEDNDLEGLPPLIPLQNNSNLEKNDGIPPLRPLTRKDTTKVKPPPFGNFHDYLQSCRSSESTSLKPGQSITDLDNCDDYNVAYKGDPINSEISIKEYTSICSVEVYAGKIPQTNIDRLLDSSQNINPESNYKRSSDASHNGQFSSNELPPLTLLPNKIPTPPLQNSGRVKRAYRRLQPPPDVTRLKKELTLVKRRCQQTQRRMNALKLRLNEYKEAKKMLEALDDMNPIAKSFITMQLRLQSVTKARGHRFTKEEKLFALMLYQESGAGFKFLNRHFHLPSKSTLLHLMKQDANYFGMDAVKEFGIFDSIEAFNEIDEEGNFE